MIAFHHRQRGGELHIIDLLTEPLETQRVPHFQFMQTIYEYSLCPIGNESRDLLAEFFAHIKLYQYAGVKIKTHLSPRSSRMICAAVVPLTGLG